MRISWPWGDSRSSDRAVTLGNFDGVHVGHRAVLERLRAEATGRGLIPTAATFEPHTLTVLAPERAPERLLTPAGRYELLRADGTLAVAAVAFDAETAALEPAAFVEELCGGPLRARCLVLSTGFRFGAGGRGDVAALRRLGRARALEVVEVPLVQVDGTPVSSTRIRTALRAGDVAGAARLLGRPHAMTGRVERGAERGRRLGFPTANLGGVPVLIPGEGIYAAWATWEGGTRPAAVHVGRRLTFEGDYTVEAHLLDFAGDLYGRELTLAFAERLRDDVRFPDAAALTRQIERDVARVRERLAPEPPPGCGPGAPGRPAASP